MIETSQQGAATRTLEPHESADALLIGLTPEQAQAAAHGDGALLVVAGPGAGKTSTLTHRIAYLLQSRRAMPCQILAVTFSVRAAGELRLRLADLLGPDVASAVTATTFHSVCARMLRDHAGVFGRDRNWSVWTEVELKKTVDWLLSDQDRIAVQSSLQSFGQPAAREVLHEISLAKNRLLGPDNYEEASTHPAAALIAAIWREAEQELRHSNAMDFDDLLVFGVRLLAEHPHYLQVYRQRYRHILVDEVQDTCPAQGMLAWLLAGSEGNLWAVGDDDQLLYSWRGADVHGLSRLAERFPGHERIVLGRNFRSHAEILTAAANSIRHNTNRVPKALIATRGPGGHAQAVAFVNEREEAAWLIRIVRKELDTGIAPGEILVLARTGWVIKTIAAAFDRAGIPNRTLGALGLYERAEVLDALAYLTLTVNPVDAQAFRRAVAAPRRGVGERIAGHLIDLAREHYNGDLIRASAQAENRQIGQPKAREHLARFGHGLEKARDALSSGRSIGQVAVDTMMLPGGLVGHYQEQAAESRNAATRREASEVLDDLRSVCRAVQEYEKRDPSPTLGGFLEEARELHARVQVTTGGEDPRITLSSIHRAKGIEATVVIVAAAEERILPSWRSLESAEQLQEERRLFYVALTRAKDRLFVTHVRQRGGRDTAGRSRFLDEAGVLTVERETATPPDDAHGAPQQQG